MRANGYDYFKIPSGTMFEWYHATQPPAPGRVSTWRLESIKIPDERWTNIIQKKVIFSPSGSGDDNMVYVGAKGRITIRDSWGSESHKRLPEVRMTTKDGFVYDLMCYRRNLTVSTLSHLFG